MCLEMVLGVRSVSLLDISPEERRVLEAVVEISRKEDGRVLSTWLESRLRYSTSLLRETCRELAARRLVTTRDLETSDLWYLLPTGDATAALKGYPIVDEHLNITVSFDHVMLSDLLRSLAALHQGQSEIVSACEGIASELRNPPSSSTTERIQTGIAVLGLALQAQPLFSRIVLPMLRKFVGN